MGLRKIKDATELQPGDRALVGKGRVETVRSASTRGAHNTVTIHTDGSDIVTTLPCPVQVEGGR
jgi:hypothetical protein